MSFAGFRALPAVFFSEAGFDLGETSIFNFVRPEQN